MTDEAMKIQEPRTSEQQLLMRSLQQIIQRKGVPLDHATHNFIEPRLGDHFSVQNGIDEVGRRGTFALIRYDQSNYKLNRKGEIL